MGGETYRPPKNQFRRRCGCEEEETDTMDAAEVTAAAAPTAAAGSESTIPAIDE